MKKTRSRMLLPLLLVLVTVLTLVPAVPVLAARPYEDSIMNCKLYDEDGMFEEADAALLSETIRKTSQEIDMYVAVIIRDTDAPTCPDSEIERLADNAYDQFFNVQYGEETDGALLYLNLSTRYAYISTCGMGQLYFFNGPADDRISRIISGMRSHLQDEDYIGAINAFCSSLKSYYKKGVPDKAYTYDYNTHQYYFQRRGQLVHADKLPFGFNVNWGLWTGIGIVVGAVTWLVAFLIVRGKYKLVKTLDASNYISHQDTHYFVRDDMFLRQHTSKTRIDSDSGRSGGGGGGGSSHMSGGGFSHGGGGGHW